MAFASYLGDFDVDAETNRAMNPAGKVRCNIMPIARGYRRDLKSLQYRSL